MKIDEKNDKYKLNRIKNSINDNENIISKKKVDLIYLYNNYYKKYLLEKEKNTELKLKDFIENDFNNDKRIFEKLKICYNFINGIQKENEYQKDIRDILIKCKLSINKLYKVRGDDHIELIRFIKENKKCSEKL